MTDAGKLASERWPDLKAAEVEAMRRDANDYGAALKDLAEAVIEHFDASKITGPLTEKARQAILMLMYENRYRTTPAGYAGVKDAEVNKSLPTQGGGAGDRETQEAAKRLSAAVDWNGPVTVSGLDIKRVLSALQAAPSEGGEAVAWFRQSRQNPEAWYQVEAREVEYLRRTGHTVQPLYAARPPAPSEEPLVGCVVVPEEITDEMIRRVLVVEFPGLYREHLRHPADGQKTAAETERRIARVRKQWAGALAAAPAPDAIRGGEG